MHARGTCDSVLNQDGTLCGESMPCPLSDSWSLKRTDTDLGSGMRSGMAGSNASPHCIGPMSFPFDEALASVGTNLNTSSFPPPIPAFSSIPARSTSMPSFGTLQEAYAEFFTSSSAHVVGHCPNTDMPSCQSPFHANQSNLETTSTCCRSYWNGTHESTAMKKREIEDALEAIINPASDSMGAAGQTETINGQDGKETSMPLYHTRCISQSQEVGRTDAGTARPRVRARRGQATDPHSIAERVWFNAGLQLRRERISERMKALQELLPNSNKADKASMLDEIIEYVKFLKLQVKVLRMSRLAGGVSASLIADAPLEDGILAAEQQVAQLMEKDMGSAMHFLQVKGLCLMPVTLASIISI